MSCYNERVNKKEEKVKGKVEEPRKACLSPSTYPKEADYVKKDRGRGKS